MYIMLHVLANRLFFFLFIYRRKYTSMCCSRMADTRPVNKTLLFVLKHSVDPIIYLETG